MHGRSHRDPLQQGWPDQSTPELHHQQSPLLLAAPYRKSETEINFAKMLFFDNSHAG